MYIANLLGKAESGACYEVPDDAPRGVPTDDLHDALLGSTLGAAVGDALGSALEFYSKSRCVTDWPQGLRTMEPSHMTGGKIAGSYTDDTEMMVATMRGILRSHRDLDRLSLDYVSEEYLRWLDSHPPDVGGQTRSAVSAMRSRGPDGGLSTMYTHSAGNGALMRAGFLLPYMNGCSIMEIISMAQNVGCLTHAVADSRDSCIAFALFQEWLMVMTPEDALSQTIRFLKEWGGSEKVQAALRRIERRHHTGVSTLPESGYVVDTLERALWPVLEGLSFEEGLVACVMAGGDTDSAGAVCGSLLGSLYGASAIPPAWLEAVKLSEQKYRIQTGAGVDPIYGMDLEQLTEALIKL